MQCEKLRSKQLSPCSNETLLCPRSTCHSGNRDLDSVTLQENEPLGISLIWCCPSDIIFSGSLMFIRLFIERTTEYNLIYRLTL